MIRTTTGTKKTLHIAVLGFLFVLFSPLIASAYPVTINSNGDVCVTSSDPTYWTPIGNTTAGITSNIPPNSTFSCGVLTIFSYMGATIGTPIDLYAYTSTSTTNTPPYYSLTEAVSNGVLLSTWHYDGSIVTPTAPPSGVEGVVNTNPNNATSTSYTVTFDGTFTNSGTFDSIVTEINNTTFGYQAQLITPIYQSGSNVPFSFNDTLYSNGSYTYRSKLYASTTGTSTPWSTYKNFVVDVLQQTVAPTGTSTPVITCDPNSGYFQSSFCNLFVYLFSPSADVFDRFNTLKDDLKDHAPFGYFTSAYNSMYAISGSTTPVFALSEVTPIMTYVFTPLKNGIAWLLWLAMLVFIYKRLANIQV